MTTLLVSRDGPVAVLCFDNPPANALSGETLARFDQALADLASDDSVRAVLITSTGPVAFLSGADITELPHLLADSAAMTARTQVVARLFERLSALPQPTVAAVQASAVGGGLELMLRCDLVVLCEAAKLALPEVRLGLIPGAGGTQHLARHIPRQKALEMILLGTSVSAAEALALGLVNRVVPADEVGSTGLALAHRLGALPRVAVQAAKRAVVSGAAGTLAEGLAIEAHQFAVVMGSADAREGTLAFLEHRPAQFTHG